MTLMSSFATFFVASLGYMYVYDCGKDRYVSLLVLIVQKDSREFIQRLCQDKV